MSNVKSGGFNAGPPVMSYNGWEPGTVVHCCSGTHDMVNYDVYDRTTDILLGKNISSTISYNSLLADVPTAQLPLSSDQPRNNIYDL